MKTDTELEAAAQRAAETRLAYCHSTLFEEKAEIPAPGEGQEPVGPFCGCDTCIVREVLDAAWPHVLELARRDVAQELT